MTGERTPDVPHMLFAIKRMTGMSWQEIGAILGVDSSTTYGWTQGQAYEAATAISIDGFYQALSFMDRGGHAENMALLRTMHEGRSLSEMLAAHEGERVMEVAGKGDGRPCSTWSKPAYKPSGLQTHWTDRVSAQDDEPRTGPDFQPNPIVRKIRLKLK